MGEVTGALEISREQSSFLWLQAKTGSLLALKVFRNFGFSSYYIVDNKIDFSRELKLHSHSNSLFEGHENYKLIATVRNPYRTLFSEYSQRLYLSKDEFKAYLEKKIQSKVNNSFYINFIRIPDYSIRIENLKEDYSKIPFIRESEFYKSGGLDYEINKLHNKTYHKINWRDYFDKSIADLIYYNSSRYFDLYGYERDSWKS